MKRRKFVTAGVLLGVLVAAALAAASVGSAANAKTSATTIKPNQPSKISWGGSKATGQGTKGVNGMVASHSASDFVPLGQVPQPSKAAAKAAGKLAGLVNRPTRHSVHGAAPIGAAPAGAPLANIPHIHSLPVTTKSYAAQAVGLTDYWQEATHGYSVTPPDQALATNGSQTLEAVNSVLQVSDSNFGHTLAAEPIEGLFAPAILASGYDIVSDPRALFDGATGRWFITVTAYDPNVQPGSAVFIAVSNTSDAQGTYNIYVLDTAFDGTVCGADGCLADQPNLGQDRYTLDISTNSYDWDSGVLNGAQLYVIDKTALAAGFLFPNLLYADVAGSTSYPGVIGNSCGAFNPTISTGFCLASIQPAVTPNQAFVTDGGGREFMLESLDPLGSVDNRVVLWALTNTSAISGTGALFLSGIVVTTQSYGEPITDTCMTIPQLALDGLSAVQCGYAQQPASGNTPFCDFFYGGGCEPGAIQANDDRMLPTTSVKTANSPATVWGGLNTDALVMDPIGNLHRRDAAAIFSLSATGFAGPFITGAQVNGQGYMGNYQNDVLYPAVAVAPNGTTAAVGFAVTGSNHNPSVGAAKFTVHAFPTAIPVVLPGADVLDDFCNETDLCGFPSADINTFYRPRYGDYSMAASWGNDLYVAGELTNPSCSDTAYLADPSCGGTRGAGSNWATGLVKIHSS